MTAGKRFGQFKADMETLVNVEMDMLYRAHEGAGRLVDLLPFPLIVVRPDRVPVSPTKFRIDGKVRLHPVISGRKRIEAAEWEPNRFAG